MFKFSINMMLLVLNTKSLTLYSHARSRTPLEKSGYGPVYRIAENVGGRKHWQIQLIGLFGEKNFGEWPTNIIRILNIP